MLSSTKRRISVLECSIPIPITADVLLTRAQERARLTGATFEEAFQSLIPSLSTLDLERLADEFLQLTCMRGPFCRIAFNSRALAQSRVALGS